MRPEVPTESDRGSSFRALLIPGRNYVVTPLLIYGNIGIFILMALSGVQVLDPDIQELVHWGANFKPLTLRGQGWRLISNCFIHIGPMHLLFNMYALLLIGGAVERYIGKARFLTAYLLTGLFGSMLSAWWQPVTVSAGASGAIFGMYGLFLFLLLTRLVDSKESRGQLPGILFFLGYNLLYGLQQGIDNAAHIGGLFGGLLVGCAFFSGLKRPDTTARKYAGLGLAAGGMLAGVFLVYMLIPQSQLTAYDRTNDLSAYREKMNRLIAAEKEVIDTYNALWAKKADTETVAATLIMLIPKYRKYRDDAAAVVPVTAELKAIQAVYLQGIDLQIEAFLGFQKAYSGRDRRLMREALAREREGNQKIKEYNDLIRTFAQHLK